MASTNKTKNLGLNSWVETDRPKRLDFVEDNEIIDEKLGDHLVDTLVHFTAEDREKFNTRIYTEHYSGTGKATRSFVLPFEPVFVIIYKRHDAFSRYDAETGYTKVNATFFPFQKSSEVAGVLNGMSLTIYQSETPYNGVYFNLNEEFGQYGLIAVR